jgi:hypothetical protein
MIDKRPEPDRMLVAQLTGEARHRARWRELTGDEEAAAVQALSELAGGRADLLAEVAGIFEGASEGELDEPLARQAAALCRKAGADPEAIPAWAEEGRRRRAAASRPPFSGGVRDPGAGLMFPGLRVVRNPDAGACYARAHREEAPASNGVMVATSVSSASPETRLITPNRRPNRRVALRRACSGHS